jgi:WD40 repeat protein
VEVWDTRTGERWGILEDGVPHEANVLCLTSMDLPPDSGEEKGDGFHPYRIAAGYTDGHIRVWRDRARPEHDMIAHTGEVLSLCTYTDERTGRVVLASGGGEDGLVKLWDFLEGSAIATLEGAALSVRGLMAYVTDGGQRLAAGDAEGLRLYDCESHALLHRSGAEGIPVKILRASGDRLVVAAEYAPISVYSSHTGELVHQLTIPGDDDQGIASLLAYTDPRTGRDRVVAGLSRGAHVHVWDTETARHLHYIAVPFFRAFSLSAYTTAEGAARVVVGSAVGAMIFDPESGEGLRMVEAQGYRATHCTYVFASQEGRITLVSGWPCKGGLAFWDLGEAPVSVECGLRAANKK